MQIVITWMFQGTCTVLWRLQLIDWQPPKFTIDDNPSAFHPDLAVRFADSVTTCTNFNFTRIRKKAEFNNLTNYKCYTFCI